MTLWEAYLLLLGRLGLNQRPSPDEADLLAAQLGGMDWGRASGRSAFNPVQWLGIPLAFVLASLGQLALVGQRQPYLGLTGLAAGAGVLVFELWRLQMDKRQTILSGEDAGRPMLLPGLEIPTESAPVRWPLVAGAYLSTALTFVFSANNDFNILACLAWLSSLTLWVAAFWAGPLPLTVEKLGSWSEWLSQARFPFSLTRTGLMLGAILVVSAWFRYYRLDSAPIAMTSDHVEKLIDVNDILNNGKRPIFEPSNGGREPMEFYLAALTAKVTGLTYLTLKIVTATTGFVALLFIFLLAKEVSDDDITALLATLAAGIGWWPNVISRNGLRFPFAMLFSAVALWLVIRALKRDRQNDLLLAGVLLGLGLYGYTPTRVVPVVVALAFTVYGLHRRSRAISLQLIAWYAIFAMILVAAFMPMIRYAVDEPDNFWRRTATRMTGEPGLDTPPATWRVLIDNEWNSLRMFQWTSDSAWLISPADTPALDWVMGACFFLGVIVLAYRYARYRNWLDLFTLLAIPVLLLPSTLALAFPIENPSLHRSGAAIPLVFVVVAAPLSVLVNYGRRLTPKWWGGLVGPVLAAFLLLISAQENYTILFERYAAQYKSSAPNSPELGAVVQGWMASIGAPDTVVIKAYPYWVDTRAVGYYAGQPGWNNVALDTQKLGELVNDPRPKLYILNQADRESITYLRRLYPQGRLSLHPSEYQNQNFLTFYVPGQADFDEKLLPQQP